MPEEDDVKEIQASHIALSRESSTVQEEVGIYPDNLAKAKGRDNERLIFIKKNSLCECKDCSKTNDAAEESNLTKLIRNHKPYDCMDCSTKEKIIKERTT